MLAGVMGGLGEFFGVDPVFLRLGYLILTIFTGFIPGIVGYVLVVVIVTEAPLVTPSKPAVEKERDDTETV
jgi:phage shock protein C